MANKFIDQNGLRYFFSKLKRMFEKKADKSDLKPVATSGKYSDLEGKPEIDTTVTEGSANAVSGGAVYTAINNSPTGGNNALCVNITGSDDGSLLSADKTFSEISAAIDEGKVVVANLEGDILQFASRFDSCINFSSSAGTTFLVLSCTEDNVWTMSQVNFATYDDVLNITPIYVNITVNDDGQVVADKTFQGLVNDYKTNKNLYVNYSNWAAIAPLTFVGKNDSGEIENMLFSTAQLYYQISFKCTADGWIFDSGDLASGEGLAEVGEAVNALNVFVAVTEDDSGNLSADKTFDELVSSIERGARVIASYNDIKIPYVGASKMSSSTGTFSVLYFQCELSNQSYMLTCEESGWQKVYLNFLHEQVDQGQNDSTQLDYIKNRTHWKETDGNETIYHKLPNEYLSIDSAPTQDSKNLVSSGAVYEKLEAVKSAIPAVPSWALQETKPAYTAKEVGADAAGKATSEVTAHNTNTEAHNDMRLLIKDLTGRLNALADSDDTTLDQMSEIVAYIKNNKNLIDNITTTKSNVADIINNLTTNVTDRPLSAAQGVALKELIDAITVPTALSQLSDDATHRLVTDSEKTAWNSKLDLTATNNAIKTFFSGKTVVFSNTAPAEGTSDDVITFVKRSG